MPNTTGDGKSYLESVTHMDLNSPGSGTLLDSIHQQLVNNDTALISWLKAMAQAAENSGVINYAAITAGLTANLNAFKFGKDNALVNGLIQALTNFGGMTDGTNLVQLDVPPTANVTPALPGSARDDLVFLEAWRDGVTGAWNSRIRVVDGVDFATYSQDGFTNTSTVVSSANVNSAVVTPQGGNASPLTSQAYYFISQQMRTNPANNCNVAVTDTGLYVAGDGSTAAKAALNTLDGYVYAIPLFRVRRRNSAAYDPDNNPLGGNSFVLALDRTPAGTNINVGASGTLLFNNTDLPANSWYVGDYIQNIGASGRLAKITAISVVSTQTTVTVTNMGTVAIPSGQWNWQPLSQRPDGLYSNIKDATDIVDLRHQVSLTGFNMQALLEKNLDLLLRGQLNTSDTPRYAREYVGLNTSGYTDDVNTLLYGKFDGSINGTANGATVTGTANGGYTPAYANGVQGQAISFPQTTTSYISYPVNVNFSSSPVTVECFFKSGAIQNTKGDGANTNLVTLVPSSGVNCNILVDSYGNLLVFAAGAQGYTISYPMAANLLFKAGDLVYVKLIFNGTSAPTVVWQGVTLTTTSTFTAANLLTSYTSVQVGGTSSVGTLAMDLVRISNIVRSGTPLPTGFSFANGDRILDGPMGDFAFISDDVGGTAGVNGRTNPYGLSRVPNQVAARVSYNGSEIRHYYGQGLTAGWSGSAGGTTQPTGSFDNSAEYSTINSNETANGTTTTFTFNKPANATGLYVINGASLSSAVIVVAGTIVTPTSLTYNSSTGLVTAVLASAPTSGQVVQHSFETAARHAHLVPSTKGFIIHDWTDDALTGNGTLTVFQTTKYNVTSVNHVRVAGAIQSSGVTTSGLNAATTLTAQATTGATTINVVSASNFVANQNIRVSKGDGTWYTTTITSISTNTITIPAIPAGTTLPQNATVQGAALVTFTVAPANGATVDLVYESVLTPALGDYLRICYQFTPYQGTGNTNPVTVEYVEHKQRVTSLGTGKVSVGSGLYNYPMTTVLPMSTGVFDYQLKGDALGTAVFPTGRGNDYYLSGVPAVTSNSASPVYGEVIPGASGLYLTLQGQRGYEAFGASSSFGVSSAPLTSAVPHLSFQCFIVKDNNTGELYLGIVDEYQSSTTLQVKADGSNTDGADLYRLQGRPLIKGYGGMTA